MKIALLNLQYDNNYGGNLQRYALMTILQRMGHDVTHLNLRFKFYPDNKLKYLKTLFWRIYDRVIHGKRAPIFQEFHQRKKYYRDCQNTESFYNKYIKHTKNIESKKELKKFQEFDAFIVGSDQVWRKKFTQMHGIESFFFDFLPNEKMRLAYGASFGSDKNELSRDDICFLTPLYNRFSAVSVREESGLNLLHQYQWKKPKAEIVLDPTLLLTKEDYNKIVTESVTHPSKGNLFCYILDQNIEKSNYIKKISHQKNLIPFKCALNEYTIPQWLRSFQESKYVITDSYHGVLFSIIYQKPFYIFKNVFRGTSRFDSLEKLLKFSFNTNVFNWDLINKQLYLAQQQSTSFLKKALSNHL